MADDYAALLAGRGPRGLALPDSAIAPDAVIAMLAGVAAQVGERFAPASWLIVADGEVAGLCSITRPPESGIVDIGYGIAPSRQRRGLASAAIGEIVTWARGRADVSALTAETGIDNRASQAVLERNGFVRVGERVDEEDGPLICWRCAAD
ncbi:GNAT family N-acetyltransferase [Sphingomonas colocasiae]|uniref:GNAT family N-acetyltransferase n=2 Tax=Sphingomonas colocasiae TaxID=1848973 RepID=A0ABS7PMG7_9SPHN|nr:GNAT family protein [Sphingomonas colocasiae]MBY8821910.1 GNAT family N-acetyltransferase [Sphingomonas colocasiae]